MTPFEAELTAGDQTYTLCFSIAAICALEGRLNKGFSAIAVEMQDTATMRVGTLREMLFAGLRAHHPKITIEEAGELIMKAGIVVTVQKVAEAIVAAFPQGDEARELRNPPAASSDQIGSTH